MEKLDTSLSVILLSKGGNASANLTNNCWDTGVDPIRKSIDFPHILAQSFRLPRPRIGGERRHHCANETSPADAQRAPRRYKRRGSIA